MFSSNGVEEPGEVRPNVIVGFEGNSGEVGSEAPSLI